MYGTTACKTLNVNDHIPNQIIQQQLANDSVQINSTNLLKRRKKYTKISLYKIEIISSFVYFEVDMPNHDVC